MVSREKFEAGFTVTLSNGEEKFQQFTVTDNTWRIYTENRAAVAQAAIDVLEANMAAVIGQRQQALENFADYVGQGGARPTEADIQIFERIIEEYSNLYMEDATVDGPIQTSIDKANQFLAAINRALHKQEKVNDWLAGTDNTAPFQGDRYADIIASLQRLHDLQFSENTSYNVTNAIQNLFLLDQRAVNADFSADVHLLQGMYHLLDG